MLKGALESQGLHPHLANHILPAHGGILRDWSTHHWGDIRVPEDEAEEARLIVQDFREALERMPPLGPDSDLGPDPTLVDAESEESDDTDQWAELERETPGMPPHLTAVQGFRDASGETSGETPANSLSDSVGLESLCGVRDLVEGKMIEGALVSQGLHPIFAEFPAGMSGSHPSGWHGEIRIPGLELLEARVVLKDFRRALDQRDSGSNPVDPASQE